MASKGAGEKIEQSPANKDGTEKVVETVNYQSPAGHGQDQAKKVGVEVVHELHPPGEDDANKRGIVGRAADAVANAAQTTKDAVSSRSNENESK